MSRVRGRILLGRLLLVLLPFVFLETILQVASFWQHRRVQSLGAPDLAAVGSKRRVLCVGDSFTYGLGATTMENNYPNQLAEILAQSQGHEEGWVVFQHGWPGRNSAMLANRLAEYLQNDQPDFLCVLIGSNNRWNSSEMDSPALRLGQDSANEFRIFAAEGFGDRWTLRWRTGRLLLIARELVLGDALRGREVPVDGTPADMTPPGETRLEGREFTLELERELLAALPLAEPPADRELATAPGTRIARAASRRSPDTRRLMDMIQQVRQAQDAVREQAVQLLGELQPRLEEAADVQLGEQYTSLLLRLGRWEEALTVGLDTAQRFGKTIPLCTCLGQALAKNGRIEEALVWISEAVRMDLSRDSTLVILGSIYRQARRYEEALRAGAGAFLLSGNLERMETNFRGSLSRTQMKEQVVLALLESLPLSPAQSLAASSVVKRTLDTSAAQRRLEDDLRYMVRLARSQGVEPVLLNYPHYLPGISAVIRRSARKLNVTLVDLNPAFNERLKTVSRRDLFVHDGHCTDRGYRLMAEEVAAALRAKSGRGN